MTKSAREFFYKKKNPKKQKNNCLILNFGSLTESSRNKKWERDQTTEIGLREKKSSGSTGFLDRRQICCYLEWHEYIFEHRRVA